MSVPNQTGESRPAAVYRLYDAAGELLYIGSSYDPDRRCKAHRKEPWWPKVAWRTEEWHAHRAKAYSAETAAIWKECPEHNTAGTRDYAAQRSGAPAVPSRQRGAYLAFISRRDACVTDEANAAYKAVTDLAMEVEPAYARRAERAAAELIEDIHGLNWPGRRRTLETGRRLTIRCLRAEGATDVEVAMIMAVVDAQIQRLPDLLMDEPDEPMPSAGGIAMFVVHAKALGSWWAYTVPAMSSASPSVESFAAIEEASRIQISKWAGIPFERVAVKIRTSEDAPAD